MYFGRPKGSGSTVEELMMKVQPMKNPFVTFELIIRRNRRSKKKTEELSLHNLKYCRNRPGILQQTILPAYSLGYPQPKLGAGQPSQGKVDGSNSDKVPQISTSLARSLGLFPALDD